MGTSSITHATGRHPRGGGSSIPERQWLGSSALRRSGCPHSRHDGGIRLAGRALEPVRAILRTALPIRPLAVSYAPASGPLKPEAFRCGPEFIGLFAKNAPVAQLDRASDYEFEGRDVRIVPGAPLRYKTGHSKTCRFCAGRRDERAQEHAFRSHDANLFRVHLDALGQGAEMVTAVAAGSRSACACGLGWRRF